MIINRKSLFVILYPISLIYQIIVGVRNKLFDYNLLPSQEFETPIITVGNITVGGTGKTPHIEHLIRLLRKEFELATLSRGYKRQTKHFIIADSNSTVNDIGDEPKQLKRKFSDISIAVDSNRVKGITQLQNEQSNLDAILLDDAYQHRYVNPGLSILLIDYNRPIREDHFLPYGDLREHPNELRRANIIIVTRSPENIKPIERRIMEKDLNTFPYQSLYFSSMKYGDLVPVFNSNNSLNFDDAKGKDIILVTGIAKAYQLKEHISSISNNINHLEYPDHHNFIDTDFDHILSEFNQIAGENKIIITTEKDAMRLQDSTNKELLKLPIYYIPITVNFLGDDGDNFDKLIFNYVMKNKKNRQLLHESHNL